MNINVTKLLDSEIFYRKISFMSFPSHHPCETEVTSVYNGSLFGLRYAYDQVFGNYLHHEDHVMEDEKITY